MAKNYRHSQRTDQNTTQTNYRKCLMSKKKNNLAFLADFNPSRYEVNKNGQNPTRNSKKTHSWSNQFSNPVANVSVKLQ